MNILKEGNRHTFINNLEIIDSLDKGNYVFSFSVKTFGCWLEKTENFRFPDKVYDIDSKLIEYVNADFKDTKNNLGVLLVGAKGQGKSLSAKKLAVETNLPVIIIKDKIPNIIDFVGFLLTIKQDYVLFVDEFEKLFSEKNSYGGENDDNHSQEVFLSFMDGVIARENKILFLLTSNDQVCEYLINRPSRVKYLKEYLDLPEEVFNEIVEDKLINKEFKEDLLQNVSFVNLNVDLLISIIVNINKFNKPFSEFSNIFNYQFENYKYDVYVIDENGKKTFDDFHVTSYKPSINDDQIFNHTVTELITFTKDKIVFNSWKWVDYNKRNKKINITVEGVRVYGNKIPFTMTA